MQENERVNEGKKRKEGWRGLGETDGRGKGES